MNEAGPYFEGSLTSKESSTPVSVRYASKYSLWLRFDQDEPQTKDVMYEKLAIMVDNKKIEMGPCRVVIENREDVDPYRLVPLGSIHDFEKLFFRSRVSILESTGINLPLILSYKRSIDERFASFVSDLTYDLGAYKTLYDQIDAEIAEEPPHVRESIRRGIYSTIGKQLMDYLHRQHEQLKDITADYTDDQHEHHGFYFRKQLWNIILITPIMSRTNLKPRGYIGDSEMMRMIYQDDYQGDSIFAQIMHKYSVDQPAAEAVRNRRSDLARILRDFVSRKIGAGLEGDQRLKVLSVACGPAMELREILLSPEDCRSLHYSLLDQDRHALLEAADIVKNIEKRLGAEVSADYIRESVRTMLVTRELQKRWGQFDFIYSMGLFDYLTRPVAVAVLKKLYNLLLPGGEMTIGNFAFENPTMVYMAYWMDWTIIYRTDEEMLSMASEIGCNDVTLHRDVTGIQIFMHIKKQATDG